MNRIKAILVDDEESALMGLKHKVEKLFPEIEILNIYQKPEDAIIAINKKDPDLVFLDIEMPRMDGFELLSKLTHINFQVIFVTAYNEYALEALKHSATDYLLKPVDDMDLKIAVNKVVQISKEKKQNESNSKIISLLSKTNSENSKIIVPTSKGISFIPQEEVMHLEGYKGYTKIHLINSDTITSSYNLGKFEKMLNNSFFKPHKSHIINIENVRHLENEGYIILDNSSRIPIAKAKKKAFLKLIK